MAAPRNNKKVAALNKENCEEHPRSNLAQNSNVPKSQRSCLRSLVRQKTAYSALYHVLTTFYEPPISGPIQNSSGDVPEHIRHKPGNEWGRRPDWSSSWSRHLPQPDDTKLPEETSYKYTRFCPKPKSCPQLIGIDHEKPSNFVRQSESSFTSIKNNRELSARVEIPSWLSDQVGLPYVFLIHRDSHPHDHLCSPIFYYFMALL